MPGDELYLPEAACCKYRAELYHTKEAAGDRPDPSCAKAAKLNIVQFATTKPSYHPPAGSSVGLLYNEHGDALSSVKLQVKICSAQVFFAVL